MKEHTTFSYVYFLTRVFFIGFGFSFLFNIANNDAWLSFLIGHLLSLGVVFYIKKIKEKYEKQNFLKEKGHLFLKILYLLFAIIVAMEILFIFQTLASNFFLVQSPHYFIILPAILLVFRICKNSWTTIGRVGSLLMYISLFMVIIALITLSGYGNTEHFLPMLTTDMPHIWQASLYYVAYSTTPLLFLILIPETNNKIPKYYFLANLTIIIMGILIISILGPDLINIYRYPEYMILKDIKILNFIEKVENVFAIATLFDLFMVLAISMNTAKNNLPKKHQNLFFIAILTFVFAGSLFFGVYYKLALQLYYYLPIILLIFLILILSYFTIYFKKNKN